jgi:hypothetical protein
MQDVKVLTMDVNKVLVFMEKKIKRLRDVGSDLLRDVDTSDEPKKVTVKVLDGCGIIQDKVCGVASKNRRHEAEYGILYNH